MIYEVEYILPESRCFFSYKDKIFVCWLLLTPIFLFLKQRNKAEEASLPYSYRSSQLYLHLPV